MKLYSPVYGEVKLEDVRNEQNFSIYCRIENGGLDAFSSDGRIYSEYPHAECVLFPSKDQRDWSKFIVPDQVPDQVNDQETKHQFKPFEKVLVRDTDDSKWNCDFFLKMIHDNHAKFKCIVCGAWAQCIPYEGNEHLFGTTNKPEK